MNEEAQNQILKPSWNYWIHQVGILFLITIVLPVIAVFYWGSHFYLFSTYSVLVGTFTLWRKIKFALQSHISISTTGISGRINGSDFKMLWDEIKAVQFSNYSDPKMLTLFTETDSLNIPIQDFDEKTLPSLLQTHLSTEVFQEPAYQKLTRFIEWKNTNAAYFSNLSRPLKVSLDASGVVIGILFLGGGGIVTIFLFPTSIQQLSAWILPFILCSIGLLLVFLSRGWLEATNEGISMYSMLHRYDFSWRNIREIYISPNGAIWALVGDDARFVIPIHLRWSGKDKEQLAQLIHYKLAASGMTPIENRKVYYWRSKNEQAF